MAESLVYKHHLLGKKQSAEQIRKKALSKRRGAFFKCLICQNEFWRQPSAIIKGENKYCCIDCFKKSQIGKPKCRPVGFRLKPRKGKDNSNWKGGITPINRAIRNSNEYKSWRTSVFERDRYTCIDCGAKSKSGNSIYLEAHHIKPFSTHPELRFDLNNGQTLCKKCHSTKPKGREICLLAM